MTSSSGGPGGPGPASEPGAQHHEDARQRLRQAGAEAQEDVRRGVEEARRRPEGLKEDAKERVGRVLDDAKARAQSAIDERKQGLAQDVDDVAHALRASAHDLEGRNKAYVARYVEQAAGSIEQIAGTLQRQDLGDLARDVEDFARRQPGLFIGGSIAAGFALARFLKSSSERRAHEAEGREMAYRAASPEVTPAASTAAYGTTQAPFEREGKDYGNAER
jgi:hypothetical protein